MNEIANSLHAHPSTEADDDATKRRKARLAAEEADERACYMSHNRPFSTEPDVLDCRNYFSSAGFASDRDVLLAARKIGLPDFLEDGFRSVVELSPGSVRVGRRFPAGSGTPSGGNLRGCISGWSGQSRARMVKVFAALDYGPLFAQPGLPAMVTLTLPGDWRAVCPDGVAWRTMLNKFYRRWERHTGDKLRMVWKKEYQRRGAPHLHFFTMVPPGPDFRVWLSRAWTQCVNPVDEGECLRHLQAGTAVDYSDGLRASDPVRLAVYFSKHGLFSEKGYQDCPPKDWPDPGRVWGYRGLKKATAEAVVSERAQVEVARLLRRFSRYVGRRRVPRHQVKIDKATGEVREKVRQRWQTRKMTRMSRDVGTVVVNNAPGLAAGIARYVEGLQTGVFGA